MVKHGILGKKKSWELKNIGSNTLIIIVNIVDF